MPNDTSWPGWSEQARAMVGISKNIELSVAKEVKNADVLIEWIRQQENDDWSPKYNIGIDDIYTTLEVSELLRAFKDEREQLAQASVAGEGNELGPVDMKIPGKHQIRPLAVLYLKGQNNLDDEFGSCNYYSRLIVVNTRRIARQLATSPDPYAFLWDILDPGWDGKRMDCSMYGDTSKDCSSRADLWHVFTVMHEIIHILKGPAYIQHHDRDQSWLYCAGNCFVDAEGNRRIEDRDQYYAKNHICWSCWVDIADHIEWTFEVP